MNKTEFLATLQSRRAGLVANLMKLSEDELTAHAAPEAWSIKDSLAHLTYYERHMLTQVRHLLGQETASAGVSKQEQTERNAQIFASNRNHSLKAVLAEMQNSFDQVVTLVKNTPDPLLTDPSRFGWLNGMPLWQYVLDETSGEHYAEHLGSLVD